LNKSPLHLGECPGRGRQEEEEGGRSRASLFQGIFQGGAGIIQAKTVSKVDAEREEEENYPGVSSRGSVELETNNKSMFLDKSMFLS
jgi:hypothetical protein